MPLRDSPVSPSLPRPLAFVLGLNEVTGLAIISPVFVGVVGPLAAIGLASVAAVLVGLAYTLGRIIPGNSPWRLLARSGLFFVLSPLALVGMDWIMRACGLWHGASNLLFLL
jgi:hypothetical protein